MSEFTKANTEEISGRCRNSLAPLIRAFNERFDTKYRLEADDLCPLDLTALGKVLQVPGLVLVFQVGSSGMLSLIPERLLANRWYKNPDESQSSQIRSLASVWAEMLLPDTLVLDQTGTLAVEQLIAEVEHSSPLEWASCLKLSVFDMPTTGSQDSETDSIAEHELSESKPSEEESDSPPTGKTVPLGSLYFIWPVQNPPLPLVPESDSDAEPACDESESDQWGSLPHADSFANHVEQLKKLPVEAIVRLAEKRVPIARLTELSPGVLLMFEKSCEELLDLYVNNQLFCRGEAVKIGEKFGLKINEVRSRVVREEKVVYG